MSRIKTWKLTQQNELVFEELDYHQNLLTLDTVSNLLPSGVYTTCRTYHTTYALRLEEHFTRLEESARLTGIEIAVNRQWLRKCIRIAIGLCAYNEAKFRIAIDLTKEVGNIYLSIEELQLLPETSYQQGVAVVCRTLHRNNPRAKVTEFIRSTTAIRQQIGENINESIMVNEKGSLLEGLSSNFFGVFNGEVWTANEGVLPGITRSLVMDEIRRSGMILMLQNISLDRIERLDEAFITSTTRAVLPVTKIDGRPVGDGQPGQITKKIMKLYEFRVENEIEEI